MNKESFLKEYMELVRKYNIKIDAEMSDPYIDDKKQYTEAELKQIEKDLRDSF